MSKQSAFAIAVNREVKRQIGQHTRARMQLAEDAALIAANEVLGLGAGRAKEFGETFCRVVNEIAELVIDDSKSDREIVYAKHVIDTRLASIVGDENFVPFDQRYGGGNGK